MEAAHTTASGVNTAAHRRTTAFCRVSNLQGGAQGALGVIFMHLVNAKDSEQAVTQMDAAGSRSFRELPSPLPARRR